MLAKVTDPPGKPVMIHRTFLTVNGTKRPWKRSACSAPEKCRRAVL
jgi:hypothetical protein